MRRTKPDQNIFKIGFCFFKLSLPCKRWEDEELSCWNVTDTSIQSDCNKKHYAIMCLKTLKGILIWSVFLCFSDFFFFKIRFFRIGSKQILKCVNYFLTFQNLISQQIWNLNDRWDFFVFAATFIWIIQLQSNRKNDLS